MSTERDSPVNDSRSMDEIFNALVRWLIVAGCDESTVVKLAARMIAGWTRFSDNSVDDRGHATYLDWMDEEVVRLLDDSERAHFLRREPYPAVCYDLN